MRYLDALWRLIDYLLLCLFIVLSTALILSKLDPGTSPIDKAHGTHPERRYKLEDIARSSSRSSITEFGSSNWLRVTFFRNYDYTMLGKFETETKQLKFTEPASAYLSNEAKASRGGAYQTIMIPMKTSIGMFQEGSGGVNMRMGPAQISWKSVLVVSALGLGVVALVLFAVTY